MAIVETGSRIFVDETERKPNRYAANVLTGIAAVVAIVCILNEMQIFSVNRVLVHTCLAVTVIMSIAVHGMVHSEKWVEHPASKYIIMTIVLLLVLTLTVLMNIHAVLAFVLPILLATQYRSHGISNLALIGSCVCCAVAPILSYFLGTWSLNFLTGYIQTFCRVTIQTTPGNGMSVWKDIEQITLFWSLPQMLSLGAFGIILYSATKSGIKSVSNQMHIADLDKDLWQQRASLLSVQEKILYAMSDIIESRDLETGDHVRRTSEIVRLLTNAMCLDANSGVTEEFCARVVKSAPMHDLGKIAVPDEILRKQGSLTRAEYDIVKQHPVKSEEIIVKALTDVEDEALLTTARNLAKYHHERMDGAGYPEGLKGKEIPLEARIMAIADVYDALVCERCYKAPLSLDEAFETIERAMGTQFDADLNPYFVACRRDIETFYRE